MKKIKSPKYIKELLNKHPKIAYGRKNYDKYQERIIKTIKLIEKYYKKPNN